MGSVIEEPWLSLAEEEERSAVGEEVWKGEGEGEEKGRGESLKVTFVPAQHKSGPSLSHTHFPLSHRPWKWNGRADATVTGHRSNGIGSRCDALGRLDSRTVLLVDD